MDRARRNNRNTFLLTHTRRNPQHALKLIAERHLNAANISSQEQNQSSSSNTDKE
jgi:hypothetical protein